MRSDLPALDAHAHIAGDVTQRELDSLGDAVVLAMTRSANEARFALRAGGATSERVVWAAGAHPGVPAALAQHDASAFAELLDRVAVVGEAGLDGRPDAAQTEVFRAILRAASEQPVIVSVHSTGARGRVLDEISRHNAAGVVLHWFNGSPAEVARAVDLDCWFSVNAAMSDDTLRLIPRDRILTETDFPAATRRTRATRPGDVGTIEARLSDLHELDARALVWRNFARLVDGAGVRSRLPAAVQSLLDTAT